jgi:NitT/TauT family transport system substrate-binding protein
MTRILTLVLNLVLAMGISSGAMAADPVTIRIGYIPVAGIGQLFVIQGENWAKERGIELKPIVFASGPNMIQGLASGTIDAYMGGIGPLAVAQARGLAVKVVASTAIEELVVVAGGRLAEAAQGAGAATAIKAAAKSLGRPVKIATQPAGSVPNTMLQYWLWEGIKADKTDIELVPMGIDATQQAILVGAVDAATIREPALTIVREARPNIRLLATGGEMFPGQPGSVLAFTGGFIKDHEAAVQTMVDLLVRATKQLSDDPKRAAPHLVNGLGKGLIDADTMGKALGSPASRYVTDPTKIITPVEKMLAFQVKIGVLDKAMPVSDLFDDHFYAKAAK